MAVDGALFGLGEECQRNCRACLGRVLCERKGVNFVGVVLSPGT